MTAAYQEYYTVDDFQHWQGDWELIDGMPYAMTPSPSVTHQTVSGNIFTELKLSATQTPETCRDCHVLMETDWQIANDTVVRPDVMVICKTIGEKVTVTPELIVEVVSISSSKRDEEMKFELYHREGVSHYLLAYPEKRLLKVYINSRNGFLKLAEYTHETTEFKVDDCRFSIDVNNIWR